MLQPIEKFVLTEELPDFSQFKSISLDPIFVLRSEKSNREETRCKLAYNKFI